MRARHRRRRVHERARGRARERESAADPDFAMPGADARVKYIEDRRLVEVAEVNVQNCWRRGRLRALSLLRAAEDGEEPLYTLEEVDFKGWAESGADMFKPRHSS